MKAKINILAAALIAATLGLVASASTADAAVAGLGASTAKSAIEQSAPKIEQVKGRGGGFRGGFKARHFGGHKHWGGHKHHWKKHRFYKHYGYYGYHASDCYWVKKWYHGYYKKFWVCH